MSSSVRCFFKSATWSKGDKVLILPWGGSFPGALTRGTYVKDLLVKRNMHPMFGHLTCSWHQPWRTGTFIKKKRWREKTTGPQIQWLAQKPRHLFVTAIHLGSKSRTLAPRTGPSPVLLLDCECARREGGYHEWEKRVSKQRGERAARLTLDWVSLGRDFLDFSSETNVREVTNTGFLNKQTLGERQDLYPGFHHKDYNVKNFY